MTSGGGELDYQTAARAFGEAYFNLIRRGADGSLKLSHDHWRLDEATDEAFQFVPREADAPPLELRHADVERIVWDRLPKQQVRRENFGRCTTLYLRIRTLSKMKIWPNTRPHCGSMPVG